MIVIYDAVGTAILYWPKMGPQCKKFVPLPNGDAGALCMGGGELAKSKDCRGKEAGKRFGVD